MAWSPWVPGDCDGEAPRPSQSGRGASSFRRYRLRPVLGAVMMTAKPLINRTIWNLLLAAIIFLPVYLLASVAELKLRGVALTEPFLHQLGGAVVVYMGLLAPALLGVIVHSASALFIPLRVAMRTRQVVVVALAPLLPLTVIVSGPAPILLDFPGSTAIATLAYGLCCARRMGMEPTAGEAVNGDVG